MLSIEEVKAGKRQSREVERKDVKGGEGREKMRQRTSRKLEVVSREVNIWNKLGKPIGLVGQSSN